MDENQLQAFALARVLWSEESESYASSEVRIRECLILHKRYKVETPVSGDLSIFVTQTYPEKLTTIATGTGS